MDSQTTTRIQKPSTLAKVTTTTTPKAKLCGLDALVGGRPSWGRQRVTRKASRSVESQLLVVLVALAIIGLHLSLGHCDPLAQQPTDAKPDNRIYVFNNISSRPGCFRFGKFE